MLSSYFTLQLWIFWTFLIATTLWKLYCPNHFNNLAEIKRLRCAYSIVLLVGYLYPLVPALSPAFSFIVDVRQPYFRLQNVSYWSGGLGYQVVNFPPLTCSPLHYGVSYYTLIMPMNISYLTSGILLAFIFRHILKVS